MGFSEQIADYIRGNNGDMTAADVADDLSRVKRGPSRVAVLDEIKLMVRRGELERGRMRLFAHAIERIRVDGIETVLGGGHRGDARENAYILVRTLLRNGPMTARECAVEAEMDTPGGRPSGAFGSIVRRLHGDGLVSPADRLWVAQ